MRPLTPSLQSFSNTRDLGGYPTPYGPTHAHRFLRSGNTASLTAHDMEVLRDWGVRSVLDLRGPAESPGLTCRLARQPWVRWQNVAFYDLDISAPSLLARASDNYLVSSYLSMLDAPAAVRAVFAFFAQAQPGECVLFHCAAGMDRTGIVALLLLGLAEVPDEQICADYCYSFASAEVVDATVRDAMASGGPTAPTLGDDFAAYILGTRLQALWEVLATLRTTYGSIASFVETCGVPTTQIKRVLSHLIDEDG